MEETESRWCSRRTKSNRSYLSAWFKSSSRSSLRRFRAGIEGCISMLKRVFGLGHCTWRVWAHFQQYVYLSITSFNLLVLARLQL